MRSLCLGFMPMPEKNGGKVSKPTNVDCLQKVFADEYYDLKLTHKLIKLQTEYHSANDVFPNSNMTSMLNNITLVVTEDQSHMYQLVETIHQLI